jgi:hypothetical protein
MEPVHPKTGKPLSDLERTLWRFRMVAHEAQVMWRGFNGYKDANDAINSALWFSLSNQAIIIVSKFREVWNAFGSLAKSDPRIIPCRRAVQVLVDRMEVWKGLDAFRDSTLAHAYLDKDGKILPPWQLFNAGLAPTFHAEIVLLLQCVVFSVLSILLVFEKEFSPLDVLAAPGNAPTPGPGPGISLGSEIGPAVRPLCASVDRLLQSECGVAAKGPVFEAFKKSLVPREAA